MVWGGAIAMGTPWGLQCWFGAIDQSYPASSTHTSTCLICSPARRRTTSSWIRYSVNWTSASPLACSLRDCTLQAADSCMTTLPDTSSPPLKTGGCPVSGESKTIAKTSNSSRIIWTVQWQHKRDFVLSRVDLCWRERERSVILLFLRACSFSTCWVELSEWWWKNGWPLIESWLVSERECVAVCQCVWCECDSEWSLIRL